MITLNCLAEIKYSKSNTLEACQKAVGGFIEVVGEKGDIVVYCNEEGLMEGLNPSAYIPDFLKFMGFKVYSSDVYIYGNVVITRDDGKLTKKQVEFIKAKRLEWKKAMDDDSDDDVDDDEPVKKNKRKNNSNSNLEENEGDQSNEIYWLKGGPDNVDREKEFDEKVKKRKKKKK